MLKLLHGCATSTLPLLGPVVFQWTIQMTDPFSFLKNIKAHLHSSSRLRRRLPIPEKLPLARTNFGEYTSFQPSLFGLEVRVDGAIKHHLTRQRPLTRQGVGRALQDAAQKRVFGRRCIKTLQQASQASIYP